MSKLFYCANCGTRLHTFRKAMPKYATIIDLVEYHECPDEPVEFDLLPEEVPIYAPKEGKDKFVQNLNSLQPQSMLSAMSSADLRDRRSSEHTKSDVDSTAPPNLLNQMKNLSNTPPAGDIEDIEE